MNQPFAPLHTATIAMQKGPYKLIYYRGYFGGDDVYELFNHEDDLEELHNLFDSEKSVAARMKDELLERLDEVNREFAGT